jgi:hypothetical protein
MNNCWGRKDWIFIGVGWLTLLGGCFLQSRTTLMSGDELLALCVIHDPSISHLISALGDQVDGAPPLYYILARFWGMLFTSSELSLRLFSAAAFCVSFALLWLILRRRFHFWQSALALAFAIGSNSVIRYENANLRFYGLLFALITLAMFVAIELVTRERPGVPLVIANILTQAALVLCHPFGGIYGSVIMAAVAISDLVAARRVRITVVGSYLVGWLAVLFWWRQFLRQADVNNPHSWIAAPQLLDLRLSLNGGIDFYALILLFPLLWVVRANASKAKSTVTNEDVPVPLSLTKGHFHLLMSLALISVIPAVWIFSRLNPSHSFFLPRYFIGAAAGWAIILAQLATYVMEPIGSCQKRSTKLLLTTLIVVGLSPLLHGRKNISSYEAATGGLDEAFGHNDLPIVFSSSYDYVLRAHYANDSARYYFLLDWPAATAPGAQPVATVEYKILDALRRNYSKFDHIVYTETFLRDHQTFLVHDSRDRLWVDLRLTPDTYTIAVLKPTQRKSDTHSKDWRMLLVKRKTTIPSGAIHDVQPR